MFCTCFSELNKIFGWHNLFCKYHLFVFSVIKKILIPYSVEKKSMTITMIQFDKEGYNMRFCFALALYASILKKKRFFCPFAKTGGGVGTLCNDGVAPPKRDTFFILQVYERVV